MTAAGSLSVRPLTGALGAVITGLDLREDSRSQAGTIAAALREHLVCFFPDQPLSPAQLVAFARHFGTVDRTSARFTAGVPEVMVRDSRHIPPNRVEDWHAQEVPEVGPPTIPWSLCTVS